jgi:enediyne polyketide synthase
LRDLRFDHPIVIPRDREISLRVAALRREPGKIDVVIRSSSTGFQVDHFSGRCVFGGSSHALRPPSPATSKCNLPLDPARDLYGRILFHRGRFCRVEGYESLHAERSTARLGPPTNAAWFARHLPQALVLGDPGARDAALHSIQASIPHKTILPLGVDSITGRAEWTSGASRVRAVERLRDGDNFIYDVSIEDAQGRTCETWEGLQLRAVAPIETDSPWPLPLLAPYVERKLAEMIGSAPIKAAIIDTCQEQRTIETRALIQEIFGPAAKLAHRPDGKPEIAGGDGRCDSVSLSHSGSLTLFVFAERAIGCDIEQISHRECDTWERMLGPDHFGLAKMLAERTGCSLDSAGTQLWTVKESLRKAGATFTQALTIGKSIGDWTAYSACSFRAATFAAKLKDHEPEFAFGFVARSAS